jgi:hypothetical protein
VTISVRTFIVSVFLLTCPLRWADNIDEREIRKQTTAHSRPSASKHWQYAIAG